MSMYLSPLEHFSSGSRIFCEKIKTTSLDDRFNRLTCDVIRTGEIEAVTKCMVVGIAPQNVSINWLMV